MKGAAQALREAERGGWTQRPAARQGHLRRQT